MLFSSYSSIAFYFYPRPPRGGRPLFGRGGNVALHISIHALREEGDPWKIRRPPTRHTFLSTPSARRATVALGQGQAEVHHFYPRPPRGGRPTTSTLSQFFARFLSTPSARRATLPDSIASKHFSISIHALREEGDYPPWQVRPPARYFYPRPPRGGRPLRHPRPDLHLHHFYPRPPRGGRRGKDSRWQPQEKFLSTPSARRATPLSCVSQSLAVISIHALREEGDL